ncbi:hypothetical protein BDV96DRAFT_571304 [Lophiotrema nucula]|uniref:CorA-like transporter domain-containing protein n=1 Tax=Lophiotrema nucula TaxID=690887 RepID=A0A6A5ZEX4_9PLEO|nr:hypothetical protein BDV96DRAFT_571304 [Lophiotrema nucula]
MSTNAMSESRYTVEHACEPGKSELFLSDPARMNRVLAEKAETTFVSNPDHVCILVLHSSKIIPGNEEPSFIPIRTTRELKSVFESHPKNSGDWMIIIPQKNSWSRLKLTLEMFSVIESSFDILPSFKEIVTSFGIKIKDEDNYYSACYRRFHWEGEKSLNHYEICYNVRFVELHGRAKPANPWSFRQYAVYQTHDCRTGCCKWLLIRHHASLRDQFRSPTSEGVQKTPWASLYLHHLLLKSSSSTWRWYLNYLSCILDETRLRTVCQSSSSRTYGHIDVTFKQCQSLELLQSQAKYAVAVLDSTILVVENLKCLLEKLLILTANPFRDNNAEELEQEFKQLSQQLLLHKRKAEDIVSGANNVNLLTQRLLELRSTVASQASHAEAQKLSIAAASESRAMVTLSEASRKDARVMKIVSVIALGYLPVGLVASFFSTELVQLASLVSDIKKGLGVFVLLVVLLTSATISAAYVWIRSDSVPIQRRTTQDEAP